jgi:hypothetical protein
VFISTLSLDKRIMSPPVQSMPEIRVVLVAESLLLIIRG